MAEKYGHDSRYRRRPSRRRRKRLRKKAIFWGATLAITVATVAAIYFVGRWKRGDYGSVRQIDEGDPIKRVESR